MATKRDYINSRADFFAVLDETIANVKKLVAKSPGLKTYEILDMQLDAMKRWSANGRTREQSEADRITIGLIAVRELEPAMDPDVYRVSSRLHELNGYFVEWPDDP